MSVFFFEILFKCLLGHLAFLIAPPPKNTYAFWKISLFFALSYPGIGKDSLLKNFLAQTELRIDEIHGEDSCQGAHLAQRLGEIARQVDAPPENAKKYWAARLENALYYPTGWGGCAQ